MRRKKTDVGDDRLVGPGDGEIEREKGGGASWQRWAERRGWANTRRRRGAGLGQEKKRVDTGEKEKRERKAGCVWKKKNMG